MLKKLIKQEERVVLIADSYYSQNDLKYILGNIDPIFNQIPIYTSADFSVSKVEGGLYSVVKEIESSYSQWHHYGNINHSDIKKAKELGIIIHYFSNTNLMKYEQNLLKSYENNRFYQGLIGSAKLARMQQPAEKCDKYNFGASFAGPILYNYVDWVIEQTLQRGFKTLYFIARDGYIPKIIADIIIKKRNLKINTRYIYSSRLAWRIPTSNNFDELINWIFEEYKNYLKPEFLAYRLGVKPQEISKMLNLKSQTSRIDKEKRLIFKEKLKNNQTIKDKLIELNKEKIQLILAYLKQEIDFSEQDIAFVDIYGSGRTQDCAALLLNEISPCKIYSFYITNNLKKQADNSIKLCYLESIEYRSNWIELLCRTSDGQTIGYKQNENRIEPITEEINGQKILNWGLNEYIDGIKEFTKYMLDAEIANKMSFNTLDLFCSYSDYFKNNLDKETANILGEIPYKGIGNEEDIECSASKISLFKILLNFLLGREQKLKSIFPNISFARSGKLTKKLWKLSEECPNIQKFLLNIYIHKRTQTAYIRILGIKFSFEKLLWGNK